MSYAEVYEEDRVVRVAEKVVISSWASSGLHGFASCAQSRQLAQRATRTITNGPGGRERFVAPLYQFLIDDGELLSPVFAADQDVIPLGTPEDLTRVSLHLQDRPTA